MVAYYKASPVDEATPTKGKPFLREETATAFEV